MHWSKKYPERWKELKERMRGNKRGEGHNISEHHKENIIKANKKRSWSPEQRERISKQIKDYYKDKSNPMQGRKHTKEAREKIVKSNLENGAKGAKHYNFRGSKAKNPRGIAWYRKRKDFIKRYSNQYGYVCQCKGETLQMGDIIDVHHIIEPRDVIDIIQDINYDWNLIFLCHACHIKIHNRLRGMFIQDIPDEFWAYYIKRMKIAKKKIKELINATKER
jgi:hypothetical protein